MSNKTTILCDCGCGRSVTLRKIRSEERASLARANRLKRHALGLTDRE